MGVFLGVLQFGGVLFFTDVYALFTFETIHNIFRGVSKLAKYCMMQYISLCTVSTKSTRVRNSLVY